MEYKLKCTGTIWPAQVRYFHLVLFILIVVPLLLCLSYLNFNQLHMITTPLKNFTAKLFQTNFNQTENSALSDHHNNINEPDLTQEMVIEKIYEAGHINVNPQICPDLGKNLKLLITVTSAPSHESTRLAVRESWGHFAIRRDVAIVFLLGATSNADLNDKIEEEQNIYGDIVRGKFIDSYDNLTLKIMSMLEWVDNYCPQVSFILKTDDDMFINVSRLLAFIAKHNPDQRAIFGLVGKKWKPVRNKKSKYYISPEQFKPAVFPDFTTGPAYLVPAQLAKEIYLTALNLTYVKLEDVFFTGIVADYLKIKRVHAGEFVNGRVKLTPCNVQKDISIHMVKSDEQYDIWKKLHDTEKCR